MKPFTCPCSNILFFENTQCLKCGSNVGYDAASDSMKIIEPEGKLKQCANGTQHGVCNWLVPADSANPLCDACQLNRTIPDLSVQGNGERWARMEASKRRVAYSMHHLGLPIIPRTQDAETGLIFDFLQPMPGAPVITGHDFGIITLNMEEADDAIRESNRQKFREPHRSLVGHFRHELAHYYWWVWFEKGTIDIELLNSFREVFGDERQDYGTALNNYYNGGPPSGWQGTHISEYSTAHPWEDWAETWAHYLHMTDALETADTFGLSAGRQHVPVTRFPKESVSLPAPFANVDPGAFMDILYHWAMLTPAINEMSLSLGQRDLYPFVLTPPIVRKLHFIHCAMERVSGKMTEKKPVFNLWSVLRRKAA
ncbi:MAG: hypothetical protein JWO89_2070 [Verrucomicrobiaceae bacterium]|nr:hypothetical protein [Verrucomicrobiaceae bacterium]MDB6119624.1 hypothetical protein [Verrucomicrobiaceae bacterium]